MKQKTIKISQARELLAANGVTICKTISGYYQAKDSEGNLITDDPAWENSEDEESVICLAVERLFPDDNYFIVANKH